MVVDRKGNAIIQRADYATSPNYIENYIQINLVAGMQTMAPITQYTRVGSTLIFLPERNEIAGIWGVDTKSTSVTPLTAETRYNYINVTSN